MEPNQRRVPKSNPPEQSPLVEIRCDLTDLQIEQRSESAEGRTITGYAARFDSWSEPIMGWFREQIARSAFEGCDLSDVIVCFNHNVDDILARTTSGTLVLSTDETGLRFSFDVPNTTRGNDMLELVRRGDINKCSFKFVVEKDDWTYADSKNRLPLDERVICTIRKVYDVALVVYPAYRETEASVRRLEQRKAEHLQEATPKSDYTHLSRQRLAEQLRLKNDST